MKTLWKWGAATVTTVVLLPVAIYSARLYQADRFLEEQKRLAQEAGFSLDPEFMNQNPVPADPENAALAYQSIEAKWRTDLETLRKARSDKKQTQVDASLATLKPAIEDAVAASKLPGFFNRRDYRRAAYLHYNEYARIKSVARLLTTAAVESRDDEAAIGYLEAARRIQHHLESDWPIFGSLTGWSSGGYWREIGNLAVKTKSPDVRARCVSLLRNPTRTDQRKWIQFDLIGTLYSTENPRWTEYMEEIPSKDIWRFEKAWLHSPVVAKEATAKAMARLLKLNSVLANDQEAMRLVKENDDQTLSGRVARSLSSERHFFRLIQSPLLNARAILLAIGEKAETRIPFVEVPVESQRIGNSTGWCHQTDGIYTLTCYWVENGKLRAWRGPIEDRKP